MDDVTGPKLNPWLSIWLHPRQTIRAIVDSNPRQAAILLVVSAGAGEVLMQIALAGPKLKATPLVLIIGGLLGAFFGWAGLYMMGWLYRWVGSWLGGTASNEETRAAIAWAKVPSIFLFVLSLVLFAAQLGSLVFIFAIVVNFWAYFILCKTLGEVNHFSAWKGLATTLIPSVVLMVPLFIFGLLAAIAIPNFIVARDKALAARSAVVEQQDNSMDQQASSTAPLPGIPEAPPSFQLKTGEVVTGKVLFEGDQHYRIQTENGETRTLFKKDLQENTL